MKNNISHLLLISVVLFLTACGGNIEKREFNRAANTHIKKIAVLIEDPPEKISVHIVHHAGLSFGLIGGLVALADQESKTSGFNKALSGDKPEIRKIIGEVISGYFEQPDSYNVSIHHVPKLEKGKFLTSYKGLDLDADAVLEIRFYGTNYVAEYSSSPYRPLVTARSRLSNIETKEVLYLSTIHYGEYGANLENLITLQPDKEFDIENYDQLINSVEKARRGLEVASAKIAERICQEIK